MKDLEQIKISPWRIQLILRLAPNKEIHLSTKHPITKTNAWLEYQANYCALIVALLCHMDNLREECEETQVTPFHFC